MGAYVNPHNTSKEQWLQRYAEEIPEPPSIEEYDQIVSEGKLPVCLVDNGPFTAAGIAFNMRELEAFSKETDPRPKKWYLAKEEDLHKVSKELERYQNAGR